MFATNHYQHHEQLQTYHFSRRFHRVYGQPPGRYRRVPTRTEPDEPLARVGLTPLADRIWRTT